MPTFSAFQGYMTLWYFDDGRRKFDNFCSKNFDKPLHRPTCITFVKSEFIPSSAVTPKKPPLPVERKKDNHR